MQHIPQRTCMGCNTKRNKSELLRVVKTKENVLLIDKSGKQEGRGAYLCNSPTCVEKLIKSKRLERCLKTKINEEFYNKLRGVVIGK